MLGIPYLWQKQIEIADALRRPPYKVLVKSGHKLGKSFAGAWLVNWWYDSFSPSGCVTIAPRLEHLTSILWKDIRIQRQMARVNLMGDLMPKAPEMRSAPDHYAIGITASKGESITGRHERKMLFLIDECVGVDPIYFTTLKTMFKGDGSCGWLAFCNPTSTTSQAYQEDGSGEWTTISLSCMDHPNLEAARRGEGIPVERAVTLEMVDSWVHSDWTNPVSAKERLATDFAWPPLEPGQPPETAKWWRAGPEFEARCMGMWPSQGTYGVWSDMLWQACLEFDAERHSVSLNTMPQIGCDVARFGDDNTELHVRLGALSLEHESHNGWDTVQTEGRLIELCREYADMVTQMRGPNRDPCKPEEIGVKIDDDGVGGGVVDHLREKGFNVTGVNAGSRAMDEYRYPNKRSELWFRTTGLARAGLLSLSRLDKKVLQKLKAQAMAPVWKLSSAGQRVVEEKAKTKEKIGRSPDGLDALNLAYYESHMFEAPPTVETNGRPPLMSDAWRDARKGSRGGRKLFGR